MSLVSTWRHTLSRPCSMHPKIWRCRILETGKAAVPMMSFVGNHPHMDDDDQPRSRGRHLTLSPCCWFRGVKPTNVFSLVAATSTKPTSYSQRLQTSPKSDSRTLSSYASTYDHRGSLSLPSMSRINAAAVSHILPWLHAPVSGCRHLVIALTGCQLL